MSQVSAQNLAIYAETHTDSTDMFQTSRVTTLTCSVVCVSYCTQAWAQDEPFDWAYRCVFRLHVFSHWSVILLALVTARTQARDEPFAWAHWHAPDCCLLSPATQTCLSHTASYIHHHHHRRRRRCRRHVVRCTHSRMKKEAKSKQTSKQTNKQTNNQTRQLTWQKYYEPTGNKPWWIPRHLSWKIGVPHQFYFTVTEWLKQWICDWRSE